MLGERGLTSYNMLLMTLRTMDYGEKFSMVFESN